MRIIEPLDVISTEDRRSLVTVEKGKEKRVSWSQQLKYLFRLVFMDDRLS